MGDEAHHERMGELRASLPNDKMGADGGAYIDFLLAQPNVKGPKAAVVGYCFTGTMSVRTAAAAPDRNSRRRLVPWRWSVHGSIRQPASAAAKIKARLYFGHAVQDRSMPTETIAKFEAVLKAWPGQSESETYEGAPARLVASRARDIYNEAQAERAFGKLNAVLEAALG